MSEVAFLVAPCRDFDGAFDLRIAVDHAGRFEGIDDAKRPVEPARKVLTFEVRSRQQLWPGFVASSEYVADAVGRRVKPRVGKLPGQPLQREHMRLGKSGLVHASLVSADAT